MKQDMISHFMNLIILKQKVKFYSVILLRFIKHWEIYVTLHNCSLLEITFEVEQQKRFLKTTNISASVLKTEEKSLCDCKLGPSGCEILGARAETKKQENSDIRYIG